MAIVQNKKAFFEYHITDRYEAGIKLQGSEVRSIRNGQVSINESFCHLINGELYIKNMTVAENKFSGKYTNHIVNRERLLLLNKSELSKIEKGLSQKGLTLIPLNIHITKTGFIKIDIGLAKGKKNFDKRSSIKDRDVSRDIQRNRYD